MKPDAPCHSLLEPLKQSGADRYDPVRFRYLESLEHRLRARGLQQGEHWERLAQAVSHYQTRLNSAGPPEPTPADEPSPLAGLLERLNQTTAPPAEAPRSALEQRVFGELPDAPPHARPASGADNPRPLKAMVRAKADTGDQVLAERIRQAIESTPKDAGPMNAHRLVSRALEEMQALSPAYLARFAGYTDTLLALERLTKKSSNPG